MHRFMQETSISACAHPPFFSHCLTFSCEGSECAEQMRDTQHDYVLD